MAERKILSKVAISCSLTFILAFSLGVIWQRYYSVDRLLLEIGVRKVEYQDISLRSEIHKEELKQPLVILIAGQSNVANTMLSIVETDLPVFNVYQDKLYKAQSPLLGNTGLGGSPWLLVAEQIIQNTDYKQVVLVPIARNNSSVLDWEEGGVFSHLISDAVIDVRRLGLEIDLVVWGQGERDSMDSLDAKVYQKALTQIFNKFFKTSDMSKALISLSSRCFQFKPSDNIRNAQIAVINELKHVYMGPDTDKFGANYRFDGCHFNEQGQRVVAQQWANKIIDLIKLQELH